MADENQEQQQAPEHSPAEIQALEQGWVPKEEFAGDEHKWVDAGEFLRRGELFQKIDSQNRKLKEIEKTFQAYKTHAERVEENAYKRALDDLKQKKVEALENADAKAVVQIDDEISDLKTKQAEIANVSVSEDPHPEFQAWTEQNTWYTNSEPMRAYADALGRTLARQGKSPSDVLKEVSKAVREEFPNKFRNPNRDKASAVESGEKSTSNANTSKSRISLSEDETRIMNTLVRGGHITKEKYMADLAAIKAKV